MANDYYILESSTNLIRLSQIMRKEKRIDLLDSNNHIVRYWDDPLSTDLKVVKGKMFEDDIDISRFFWDEIYWLYRYFYCQYEDENKSFDGSEEQSYDFISFRTYTDFDYQDEIDPYLRAPNYIGKYFTCDFIHYWIMIKLQIDPNEDVDNTLMSDLQHIGQILPTITWNAGGLIIPLFGSKYFHLIEGSIQSLVDTYKKEDVEMLISYTTNYPITREFGPHTTFWQHQFRNFSMPLSWDDLHNVKATRKQLLELLNIFKQFGLNILTLEQVRNQCLACNACPRNVHYQNVKGTEILVQKFGFEILAFPGDYENKSLPGWELVRELPLISNINYTYEVLRANADLIQTTKKNAQKRKFDDM